MPVPVLVPVLVPVPVLEPELLLLEPEPVLLPELLQPEPELLSVRLLQRHRPVRFPQGRLPQVRWRFQRQSDLLL